MAIATTWKRFHSGSWWAEGPSKFPSLRLLIFGVNIRLTTGVMQMTEGCGCPRFMIMPSNTAMVQHGTLKGVLLPCEHLTRRVTRNETYGSSDSDCRQLMAGKRP